MCRSIVMTTRNNIANLCGVDQLCSGIKGSIEGAFHAMKELFESKTASGWGLLLVDANNAFNSFNRIAAIWNTRIQWSLCAKYVFNTYHGYAPLVVQTEHNAEFIFSKEGVAHARRSTLNADVCSCLNISLSFSPATFDGCGAAFSYEHALNFKKGGLITRHSW